MKREFYLDGSVITSQEDFHNQVKELLGLPSYYSKTLDDFWSCMTSYIDPNIRLIVNDFDNIIKVFGLEAEAIKEIFNRLTDECPEMDILMN